MRVFHSLLSAAAAVVLAGAAHAATINGTDFQNGLATQTIGGIVWTAEPTGRTFEKKSRDGVTGVGLSGGRTPGEIDIGETLIGTVQGAPVRIASITIGLLFDGPEFGDVNERAQITINGPGGLAFVLTAVDATTATWSGGGSVANLSPATFEGGGVWRIDNPFGLEAVSALAFTAIPGVCGTAGGACNNQSDFTLVQLVTTPVPVPAALALFGVAVAGLVAVRRRRN